MSIVKLSEEDLNITTVKNLLSQSTIHVNSFIIYNKSLKCTTLLSAAVSKNDSDLLEYLLTQNADVNNKTDKGTPLWEAVLTGNVQIFQRLHDLGGNINFIHRCGQSLLTRAALLKNNDLIEYMIKHGVDVNAASSLDGLTPLHYLCISDDDDKIAELLLDKNAEIDKKDHKSMTPLMHAAISGSSKIIKLLISRGADINEATGLYDKSFSNLFEYRDSVELVEYLLTLDEPVTDIHRISSNGQTVLHRRVERGHFKTIRQYLDAGVDINMKDSKGKLAINCRFKDSIDTKSVDHIKKHIVKLISAGLPVCEENQLAVEGMFGDLKEKCTTEIEKMKINRIGRSNIAFFDLLNMSDHYLAVRLKLVSLDIFDKVSLESEFPLYGGMLFYKLSKVKRRTKYLKEVENIVESILGEFGVPLTFIRELWYYFTSIELKKIILEKNERIDKFL